VITPRTRALPLYTLFFSRLFSLRTTASWEFPVKEKRSLTAGIIQQENGRGGSAGRRVGGIFCEVPSRREKKTKALLGE